MRNYFKGTPLAIFALLLLNFVSIVIYFLYSDEYVIERFFEYGFYHWNDARRQVAFMLFSQVATCVVLIILIKLNLKSNDAPSLFGLWLKRRRLEEEKRIKDLS